MPAGRRPRSRGIVLHTRRVQLLLVVSVALAACGDAPPPGSATPSPVGPTPVPTAPGESPSPSTPVGQTETEWGRIWDALPDAFPRYPGSIPTETRAGPVSAEFAVGADAVSITTWLQASLESAGYSTEALSGPLEDGSRVIESIADGGCRVETVVTPLSGTTHVTVRFGAACPFG
jgi:hypothetical protein